jgi:hypothetical protein
VLGFTKDDFVSEFQLCIWKGLATWDANKDNGCSFAVYFTRKYWDVIRTFRKSMYGNTKRKGTITPIDDIQNTKDALKLGVTEPEMDTLSFYIQEFDTKVSEKYAKAKSWLTILQMELDGYSQEEIANQLQISKVYVRKLKHNMQHSDIVRSYAKELEHGHPNSLLIALGSRVVSPASAY